MQYIQTVALGEPLRDQRAVTGRGVSLDTHERRGMIAQERRHQRGEVDPVEDLRQVAFAVLGCQDLARALADPRFESSRYCRWRSSVVGASSGRCS